MFFTYGLVANGTLYTLSVVAMQTGLLSSWHVVKVSKHQ